MQADRLADVVLRRRNGYVVQGPITWIRAIHAGVHPVALRDQMSKKGGPEPVPKNYAGSRSAVLSSPW